MFFINKFIIQFLCLVIIGSNKHNVHTISFKMEPTTNIVILKLNSGKRTKKKWKQINYEIPNKHLKHNNVKI